MLCVIIQTSSSQREREKVDIYACTEKKGTLYVSRDDDDACLVDPHTNPSHSHHHDVVSIFLSYAVLNSKHGERFVWIFFGP